MRVLLWHVHGSYTTALVQGGHDYFAARRARTRARRPGSGPDLGLARRRAGGDARAGEATSTWTSWSSSGPRSSSTSAAVAGPAPRCDLPTVYLEHNAPQGRIDEMRHPVGRPRRDLPSSTSPTSTPSSGTAAGPGPGSSNTASPTRGTSSTGGLSGSPSPLNEPMRRGRVTGTDLSRGSPSAGPSTSSAFAPRSSRRCSARWATPTRTCRRARCTHEMARRRVYLHPVRWTSLGPVLDRGDAPRPARRRAGHDRGRGGGAPRRRRPVEPTRRAWSGRWTASWPTVTTPGRPAPGRGRRHSAASGSTGSSRLGPPVQGGDPMRIAMVSEHASPLARSAASMPAARTCTSPRWPPPSAALGHEVVVHTRRDDPASPTEVPWADGSSSTTSTPARRSRSPRTTCSPTWPPSPSSSRRCGAAGAPMSSTATSGCRGWPPSRAAGPLGIPVVHTFHTLGVVKRRHLGGRRHEPPRPARGRALAGRVPRPHRGDLQRRGLRAAPPRGAGRPPRGRAVWRRPRPVRPGRPDAPAERDRRRLVSVGRLVERKGVDDADRALALLPGRRAGRGRRSGRRRLRRRPDARPSARRWPNASGSADRSVFLGRVGATRWPLLMRSATVVACVPGTSRSGSCRWRPWRAARRSWPARSAASSTPSSTASPACTSNPRRPAPPGAGARRSSWPTGPRRRRWRAQGGAGSSARYGWSTRGRRRRADVYAGLLPATPQARGGEPMTTPTPSGHRSGPRRAAATPSEASTPTWPPCEDVGRRLAGLLDRGGRVLVAGNGGCAAHAQHLTSELVGRFRGERRRSAPSACTATPRRDRHRQRLRGR